MRQVSRSGKLHVSRICPKFCVFVFLFNFKCDKITRSGKLFKAVKRATNGWILSYQNRRIYNNQIF